MASINNKDLKCYNCGKIFVSQSKLDRHKNSKTPCLIRELLPEQVNNPNRCRFCNSIFSNKGNLNKHYDRCKIKNGGMEILAEKIQKDKHDEILQKNEEVERIQKIKDDEIQALKEVIKQQNESIKRQDENINRMMSIFEKQIGYNNRPNVVKKIAKEHMDVDNIDAERGNAIHINNSTINGDINVNITNNLIFNPYDNPDLSRVKFTAEDIKNNDKVFNAVIKKIYINPDIPENHSVYLLNKKERSLIVYDGSDWDIIEGDEVERTVREMTNIAYTKGGMIFNDSATYGGDKGIVAMPADMRQKIQDFNGFSDFKNDEKRYDAIFNVLLSGKPVLADTYHSYKESRKNTNRQLIKSDDE